ncbi:MAG: TVP38/TMEM64 family protein [Verrucomicrobia bacterium]|nr:TVP38/TMEM64 family protein [Verrucomicrobiota bacterium]
MSSSEEAPVAKKKLPVVKLAVAGVVLAIAAVFLLRGVDFVAVKERAFALIRGVGPVTFFSAMAVLPTFAVPITLFTIPAGEAFAPQFGMGGVIAICLAILAVNLALTYWVARYAARPLLTRLLQRYGYTVPRATPENALAITVVMRLTPGPPYAVQGYVLGIAEVPFGLYMVGSWLCQAPYAVGFIVLGQGLLNGNFMLAAKGLGVLVVAIFAVQWWRKKNAKREN